MITLDSSVFSGAWQLPACLKRAWELWSQKQSPKEQGNLCLSMTHCICSLYESFAWRVTLMCAALLGSACGSISSGRRSKRSSANLLLCLFAERDWQWAITLRACVCVCVCLQQRLCLLLTHQGGCECACDMCLTEACMASPSYYI